MAYEGMYSMATSENNPHINLGYLTEYIQYGFAWRSCLCTQCH